MRGKVFLMQWVLFGSAICLSIGLVTPGLAKSSADSLKFAQTMTQAADARAAGKYPLALQKYTQALQLAEASGNDPGKLRVLMEASFLRLILNDFDIALELLFSAEELSKDLQDTAALADVFNTIGANYHMQDEFEKASDYYKSSIDLYLKLNKKVEIARAYNNIGVLWKDREDPYTALHYHRKSLALWESMDESSWIRVTKMHIGVAHKQLNKLDSAKIYLTQIIDGIEAGQEYQTLAMVYAELGDIALAAGQNTTALKWCKKGLALASEVRVTNSQMSNCKCLYQAYENLQQPREALKYFKRFAAYQDSTFNKEKAKEMTRVEMGHKFERQQIADSVRRSQEQLVLDLQHQEELANERADRNIALGVGLGILLLAGGLWSRLQYVRKAQRTIKKERDRSDNLLLNILPAEIASELKADGKAKAKRFEEATILFTDFRGFTATAAQLPADELVEEINACFTAFDKICEKHQVEKIKTIGDAYMAAGGIPVPQADATRNVALAALDMQEFLQSRARERHAQNLPAFSMRAGLHVGPIVAGVVGVKKFQYDVWGDTVNTASRMESCGQVGEVNISKQAYEHLKSYPDFQFKYRGYIAAKGKGEVEMWFVQHAPQPSDAKTSA